MNVHEKPISNSKIIGKLYEDLDFSYIASETSDWWYVKESGYDGVKGYVHKSRVAPFDIGDTQNCTCKGGYVDAESPPAVLPGQVGQTKLSACGYLKQRDGHNKTLMSFFALENCTTNELLMDAQGHYVYHFIEYTKDGVLVQESPVMPVGKHWQRYRYPLFERRGQEVNGIFTLSEQVFNPPAFVATPKEVANLKQWVHDIGAQKVIESETDTYNITARLFVCAITSDKECEYLFLNLGDFIGLDGATAEYHNDFLTVIIGHPIGNHSILNLDSH